jgi:hypothetical protein
VSIQIRVTKPERRLDVKEANIIRITTDSKGQGEREREIEIKIGNSSRAVD